ncbi:helix-turn-helix domain-containing protein [Cesiribacter sp. SM1]|uniref:helix-turn-helix domain-containing protein n=1 Tax=Cesiribacter sp. SM1 TaxID=2861196 RepID=UPI001CD7EEC9|nr:helix-turn-helix domain-containing protein [Cesiribacter sp. SM1]
MSREVTLSASEKGYLQGILKKGRHSVRKVKRARILLLLSEGVSAEEIASKADVVLSTVYKIWNRYLEVGKDAKEAIEEKPRSGQPPKLTDEVKAQITAIACSDPPEGNEYWTLQMICDKVVELGYVEKLSTEPVRRFLKKSCLNPGKRSNGSSVK